MAKKTRAIFFPFDLFGSAGSGAGAQLLADAFRELLDDNRREKVATRARCYAGKIDVRELAFDDIASYDAWRSTAVKLVRKAFSQGDFLIWASGNHLGVLPVYEELSARSDTLVIQFDAHLDIYNLTDCTANLSHGNFLLHCKKLPPVVNIGHRDLLLRPQHVRKYYRQTFSAAELAIHPDKVLRAVAAACEKASRVFVDLDCDVFDPAYFPATSQAVPFGISPTTLLRFLDVIGFERLAGLAISEFNPTRDQADRSLETLMWLIEYLLLERYQV